MTQVKTFTVDEYFALERASDVKHEYIDGEIREMPGTSRSHSSIQYRLLGWLYVHFNAVSNPCFVSGSESRVSIDQTKYVYPDVVVTCGEEQYLPGVHPDTLTNPTLIVEILSDSTAEYDQGDKLNLYHEVESLQQIVFVDQYRVVVQVWTRVGRTWTRREYVGLDSTVMLESIGVTLDLRDMYRDVKFE
jgi:Uma2 family endonuclease